MISFRFVLPIKNVLNCHNIDPVPHQPLPQRPLPPTAPVCRKPLKSITAYLCDFEINHKI